MAGRIEKLEELLASTPHDNTLRYMLAMECDRLEETERALTLFCELMEQVSPYVPAFVMAGQLLVRLGRLDRARAIFQAGIKAANLQHQNHAAGEMKEFLRRLTN
jgi:predicted RNA polymerase sigma factor